jgi:hypothetical protein
LIQIRFDGPKIIKLIVARRLSSSLFNFRKKKNFIALVIGDPEMILKQVQDDFRMTQDEASTLKRIHFPVTFDKGRVALLFTGLSYLQRF